MERKQAGEEESEASDSNSEVVEVEADAALEKYEVGAVPCSSA